jgi:hypothetical protein
MRLPQLRCTVLAEDCTRPSMPWAVSLRVTVHGRSGGVPRRGVTTTAPHWAKPVRRGWGAGGWVHDAAGGDLLRAQQLTAGQADYRVGVSVSCHWCSPSRQAAVVRRVRNWTARGDARSRRGMWVSRQPGVGTRDCRLAGGTPPMALWVQAEERGGARVGSNLSRRVWPARCVEIRSLLHLASICGQPGLPQWRGSSARSSPVMRQACRAHHR